ncbi:MAG: hypothetical protein HOQ20_10855 [Bradyrhizobium sp.]|nr:hypothetical protein [Bradyrhizobium sp.]
MTNGTIQRQERLIEVIASGLAAIEAKAGERPVWNSSSYDIIRAYDERRAKLVEDFRELLSSTEGARFSKPSHDYAVTLAGFRASSTSSWEGALTNWHTGACRRLGKDGYQRVDPRRIVT